MGNPESVDSSLTRSYRYFNQESDRAVPPTSPKKILAANLRRIRNLTGFSQEALADRAGMHRTYISSVERAGRNISLETLFAIAEALGVEASELIAAPDDGES